MFLFASMLLLSYPLLISSQNVTNSSSIIKSCGCRDINKSYIVTRLWNIVGEGWTDQAVIDEFDRGFAPVVTQMEGFRQYTSAMTGNESTVFFFNIFATPADALQAQQGAGQFVSDGVLSGNILPNEFTESQITFHFSSDECVDTTHEGDHLSTRLWKLKPESTITIDEVADIFEEGFAPIITQTEGFLEYAGAPVSFTNKIFFYNLFEDRETGLQANKLAADFVLNGELNDQIERVVFTEGMLGFDYACAIPSTQVVEIEEAETEDDSNEPEEDMSESGTKSIFSTVTSAFAIGTAAFMLCVTA